MANNLKPPLGEANGIPNHDELKHEEGLRLLSRSPHPYHRRNDELLDPSGPLTNSIPTHPTDGLHDPQLPSPAFTKDSTPELDSGSEADDELYVKRLPAPKAALHKGLRGRHELLSETSTPLLTPTTSTYDHDGMLSRAKSRIQREEDRRQVERTRRGRELKRRGTEVLILGGLSWLVLRNPEVRPYATEAKRASQAQLALFATLLLLYPVRVVIWAYRSGQAVKQRIPLAIPSSFDPAPLLYPPLIPILVALLTAANVRGVVLPNLVLSIASIPSTLVPTVETFGNTNTLHWLLTCLPLGYYPDFSATWAAHGLTFSAEELVCLYPLHQNVSALLQSLIRESLLPAEHQLLSISLINLLLFSTSPQAVILQALLWIGGLLVLITCGPVVYWSIKLSMVRKWRFRRNQDSTRTWALACVDSLFLTAIGLFSSKRPRKSSGYGSADTEESASASGFTTDEDGTRKPRSSHRRSVSLHTDGPSDDEPLRRSETIALTSAGRTLAGLEEPEKLSLHQRRRTLPFAQSMMKPSKTHTPSGRPKRSVSASIRVFFGLTAEEASIRKWQYAAWVYLAIVATIFIAIREWVQRFALGGNEPICWALGYIFGNIHPFRMYVISSTESSWLSWIVLPDRPSETDTHLHQGWVEHLRHASYGEANTRLLLSAYWAGVIVIGLTIVFRLTSYEVDTRRKIFHFTMVAMFLPMIYVDPTWCALALSIALAIFLLLDLLRASQLPPLSKPISNFLQPYTDGRDHLGPVVISHIFLLIGCAIPLWLSLASLPRSGTGMMKGWEVPTRELSMVTGVVCVGLGDAAASLCGRRWGKHKWCWKGGKSLEGSVAFAAAVLVGLTAANLWLRVGGWPITGHHATAQGIEGILTELKEWEWHSALLKTGLCASVSSLTEAVLTGGNDNVVVPVVLWTCVKSTGL